MTDHSSVLHAHGYHKLRVKDVVRETHDANSFVLDVPEELLATFQYRPGQFCTFRVPVDGVEQVRSYSMSSTPEIDADLTVTVKRVEGGLVSNWFLDHVGVGDLIEVTKPAGVFCPQDAAEGPVLGFCGGSGVTPVMSITKHVLANSRRPVRLLYANRDRESVIFDAAFGALGEEHPERLDVRHHLDDAGGFLTADCHQGVRRGGGRRRRLLRLRSRPVHGSRGVGAGGAGRAGRTHLHRALPRRAAGEGRRRGPRPKRRAQRRSCQQR